MTIKTSKYNEIGINEVRRLINDGIINCPAHIKEWDHSIGAFAGTVTINGDTKKLHAGDEIIINNVNLTMAKENDDYFDCEININ